MPLETLAACLLPRRFIFVLFRHLYMLYSKTKRVIIDRIITVRSTVPTYTDYKCYNYVSIDVGLCIM